MELNDRALEIIESSSLPDDGSQVPESNYWDFECTMSRENLSNVLYATIVCGGSIPDTFTLAKNLEEDDRSKNARRAACFRVKLPKGERERWEEIVGYKLRERDIRP